MFPRLSPFVVIVTLDDGEQRCFSIYHCSFIHTLNAFHLFISNSTFERFVKQTDKSVIAIFLYSGVLLALLLICPMHVIIFKWVFQDSCVWQLARVSGEVTKLQWMRQWWKIRSNTSCMHAGLFSGGFFCLFYGRNLFGLLIFGFWTVCLKFLHLLFYLLLFLFLPRWLSSFISEVYLWLCISQLLHLVKELCCLFWSSQRK